MPPATGWLHPICDAIAARRPPVIVLDHTALDDWRWGLALTLYLRDAYVRRSTVSLIQVGAAPPEGVTASSITSDELRARHLHLRNVRARALYEAMAAPRGRATPLAHGLELAAQTIRAATTRGRGRSTKIQLVVVSDGRGNGRAAPAERCPRRPADPPRRGAGRHDALACPGWRRLDVTRELASPTVPSFLEVASASKVEVKLETTQATAAPAPVGNASPMPPPAETSGGRIAALLDATPPPEEIVLHIQRSNDKQHGFRLYVDGQILEERVLAPPPKRVIEHGSSTDVIKHARITAAQSIEVGLVLTIAV